MLHYHVRSLAVAIMVAGCAHSTSTNLSAQSPSELNTYPQRYHGQNVVVEGFVTLAPGAHNIYQSKALKIEFERQWKSGDSAFDPKTYQAYCLTIANPEALLANREALNGMTITVMGKFVDNYLGGKIDLGACPLPTAILIDVDDLKRRYPSAFTN